MCSGRPSDGCTIYATARRRPLTLNTSIKLLFLECGEGRTRFVSSPVKICDGPSVEKPSRDTVSDHLRTYHLCVKDSDSLLMSFATVSHAFGRRIPRAETHSAGAFPNLSPDDIAALERRQPGEGPEPEITWVGNFAQGGGAIVVRALERVCSPSPQTAIWPPLGVIATSRQIRSGCLLAPSGASPLKPEDNHFSARRIPAPGLRFINPN